MTKFCGACHSPNRDGARHCQCCGGKFSGVVSGSTVFHILDEPDEARTASRPVEPGVPEPPPSPARQRLAEAPLRAETGADNGLAIVRLGIVITMLLGAFGAWYWNRPAAASSSDMAAAIAKLVVDIAAPSPKSPPPALVAPQGATNTAQAHEKAMQADPQAKDDLVPEMPRAALTPLPRQQVAASPERPATATAVPPPASLTRRAWTPPPQAMQAATTHEAPQGSSACDGNALCVPMTRSRPAAASAAAPVAAAAVEAASPADMAAGAGTQRVIVFKGTPVVVNVGVPAVQSGGR
ncbi:hypothetical protein ACIPRI_24140 [Variovorax sp. LARHSF232]